MLDLFDQKYNKNNIITTLCVYPWEIILIGGFGAQEKKKSV